MDIKNLPPQALQEKILSWGFPRYRTQQVLDWIYKKNIADFGAMDNLPQDLRSLLGENFTLASLKIEKRVKSKIDGTVKYLFKLQDANFIEAVAVPMRGSFTVCVSVQAGCRFACKFCATGSMGFVRNLTVAEILEQVLVPKRENLHISNIVFMGMGEPLDNYDNVACAIKILNSKDCLGFGARKITVSTCGLPDGIRRLAGLGIQVELSVSLHAPDNELRDRIVPVNKKYPIEKVLDSVEFFVEKTKRKVTFEYVLIDGTNDSAQQARQLASLIKYLNPKVNLIPLSPVKGAFRVSKRAQEFKEILDNAGIAATIRQSKGADIRAACGQLRGLVT